VLVVVLAGFIVVSQDANVVRDQRQAELEPMRATAHPPEKFPDNHLDECCLCQIEVFAKQEPGFHMGQYANRARVVNKPNGGCSCAEENSSRLTTWSCAVAERVWEQIVEIYMTMDRVMFVSPQTAVPKNVDKLPVLSGTYAAAPSKVYKSYFSEISDALSTKLQGIVKLSDLIKYLDLGDPAEGLPLLNEVVQYGDAAVRDPSSTGQGTLGDLCKTLQD
jgi:hypothetical protein